MAQNSHRASIVSPFSQLVSGGSSERPLWATMLWMFPLPWWVLVDATRLSPSCLIEILLIHSFPGAPLSGSCMVTRTLFAILEPLASSEPMLFEIQGATKTVKTT